jgi:hypothetical protein
MRRCLAHIAAALLLLGLGLLICPAMPLFVAGRFPRWVLRAAGWVNDRLDYLDAWGEQG